MLKVVCIMLGVAVNALPTDIELTPNGRGTNFATVGGSSPTVCGVDPPMACSAHAPGIANGANCVTPNSVVQSYVSPAGTPLLGFVNDGAKGAVPGEYDRICSDFPPQDAVMSPGAGGMRNYALTQCDAPECPVYRIFDTGAVTVGDELQFELQGTVPTFLEEGSPALVGVGASHECGQWWSFERDVVDSSPFEIFNNQAVCANGKNQWWRNTETPTGEPASKGTVVDASMGWIVRCLMGGSPNTPYATVGQTQVLNCLTNCDENSDKQGVNCQGEQSIGVGSDILQVRITEEVLLSQCYQCRLTDPNAKVTESCPINNPFSPDPDKWQKIKFIPSGRYCNSEPGSL